VPDNFLEKPEQGLFLDQQFLVVVHQPVRPAVGAIQFDHFFRWAENRNRADQNPILENGSRAHYNVETQIMRVMRIV